MILIKNGNVHFPKGEVYKTDILIDGARIVEIKNEISADSQIIDASECEVFPGFILPATSVGIYNYADLRYSDSDEKSSPINADLHVKYALDPVEVRLQGYEKHGITSFGAVPNNSSLVAGQTGIYHTTGTTSSEMAVSENVALKVNFFPNVKHTFSKFKDGPMTRLGMATMLRNELQKAFSKKKECSFYDPSGDVFRKVLNKELPILCNVRESFDIETIMELQQEFKFNLILLGAYQADQVKEKLENANVSILLGDLIDSSYVTYYQADIPELIEMTKKIPMAFSNNGSGFEGLLWSAEKAVRNGLDVDKAIDMLTINTANIMGVSDNIGSVEKGKYADISIWSGHPLKTYTSQIKVCITAGNVWRSE
mgnify:CR=1 FL=1